MRSAVLVTLACGLGLAVAARAPEAAAQELMLRRVMLSEGGIGYFEYQAAVTGTMTLGLDVRRDQVSDVLASIVVLDAAGSVARLELPSEEGSDAALAALPIPRAALDRPLDLLNALQGVVVEVAGSHPMTGRILHAEPPPELAGGGPPVAADPRLGKTRVTLLTDAGLQQFVLEDVTSVQVADPVLRGRLQAALDSLRGTAAAERRHLSITLEGTGPRDVRIGMVVGAPLWKMTYRLDVPETADAPARLQGWAVLENTGLSDWKGTILQLQSGNPVAFRQDVYKTYLVERPQIPVDVLIHPLPETDTGAIPVPLLSAQRSMNRAVRQRTPPAAAMAMAAPALMAPPAETAQAVQGLVDTVFTVANPVSLAAGHTAALPILDRSVSARRVFLLEFEKPHPLAAVRLQNDTGSGLPPGMVTTYDATGFTGDARLGPLPAGESRLLGFAEDPATTAQWQTGSAKNVVSLTASRGVMRLTRRLRTTTTVDLRAPPSQGRDLLVEIPRESDATLTTEPSLPAEQTASVWRLSVALHAGEQLRLLAHADRQITEEIRLAADDLDNVFALRADQNLSPTARAALQHLADLRSAASDRDAERDRLQTQRTAVESDEQRLRDNLAAVPPTDELHGRLLRALDADEEQLSRLRDAVDAAARAAQQAHQALADAVQSFAI